MTKETLLKFCSSDREYISAPFTQGDYSYATDGRIILRVPRLPDVEEVATAPKNVDQNQFIGNPFNADTLRELPKDIPVSGDDEPCETCCGSGEHYCQSCAESHDCSRCHASGRVTQKAIPVRFGIHLVSNKILNQVKDLPNIRLAESSLGKLHGLAFFFDGGEGRLMPLQDPADE